MAVFQTVRNLHNRRSFTACEWCGKGGGEEEGRLRGGVGKKKKCFSAEQQSFQVDSQERNLTKILPDRHNELDKLVRS